MFIVYGEKFATEPLGYVADICQACNDVMPMELYREGIKSHLYMMGVGELKETSEQVKCLTCGFEQQVDGKKYKKVCTDLRPSPELVELTNPSANEDLQAIKVIQAGRSDTRKELMQQVFCGVLVMSARLCSPQRIAVSKLGIWVGLALLLAMIVLVSIADAQSNEDLAKMWAVSALVPMALGMGLAVYAGRSGARAVRSRMVSYLNRCMASFCPTHVEVESLLDMVDGKKNPVLRFLNNCDVDQASGRVMFEGVSLNQVAT